MNAPHRASSPRITCTKPTIPRSCSATIVRVSLTAEQDGASRRPVGSRGRRRPERHRSRRLGSDASSCQRAARRSRSRRTSLPRGSAGRRTRPEPIRSWLPTLETPGVRLRLVAEISPALYRSGSGEPVLLLHGFTGAWMHWRPLLERLSSRYEVIAPTLAGHDGGAPYPSDLPLTLPAPWGCSTRNSTSSAWEMRTSSATRWAARSRWSSPSVGERAPSLLSLRPVAGAPATGRRAGWRASSLDSCA